MDTTIKGSVKVPAIGDKGGWLKRLKRPTKPKSRKSVEACYRQARGSKEFLEKTCGKLGDKGRGRRKKKKRKKRKKRTKAAPQKTRASVGRPLRGGAQMMTFATPFGPHSIKSSSMASRALMLGGRYRPFTFSSHSIAHSRRNYAANLATFTKPQMTPDEMMSIYQTYNIFRGTQQTDNTAERRRAAAALAVPPPAAPAAPAAPATFAERKAARAAQYAAKKAEAKAKFLKPRLARNSERRASLLQSVRNQKATLKERRKSLPVDFRLGPSMTAIKDRIRRLKQREKALSPKSADVPGGSGGGRGGGRGGRGGSGGGRGEKPKTLAEKDAEWRAARDAELGAARGEGGGGPAVGPESGMFNVQSEMGEKKSYPDPFAAGGGGDASLVSPAARASGAPKPIVLGHRNNDVAITDPALSPALQGPVGGMNRATLPDEFKGGKKNHPNASPAAGGPNQNMVNSFKLASEALVTGFNPIVQSLNAAVDKLQNLPALQLQMETTVKPVEVILNGASIIANFQDGIREEIKVSIAQAINEQLGQSIDR